FRAVPSQPSDAGASFRGVSVPGIIRRLRAHAPRKPSSRMGGSATRSRSATPGSAACSRPRSRAAVAFAARITPASVTRTSGSGRSWKACTESRLLAGGVTAAKHLSLPGAGPIHETRAGRGLAAWAEVRVHAPDAGRADLRAAARAHLLHPHLQEVAHLHLDRL